jgi:predicted esterase
MFKLLLLLVAVSLVSCSYKPVIYLHGLLDSYQSFVFFEKALKQRDPSTKIFSLRNFDRMESALIPLFQQVEIVTKEIKKLQKEHNFTNFNFIGFSQGGESKKLLTFHRNYWKSNGDESKY